MSVRSGRTGEFTNTASATEEGGLSAEASVTTVVRQPVLAVTKTGPELRYLGRSATYEITVGNTGDAPARDLMKVDVRALRNLTRKAGLAMELLLLKHRIQQ